MEQRGTLRSARLVKGAMQSFTAAVGSARGALRRSPARVPIPLASLYNRAAVSARAAASTLAPSATKKLGGGNLIYRVKVYVLGTRDVVRLRLAAVDEELGDDGSVIAAANTIDFSTAAAEPYERANPSKAGTLVAADLILPADFNLGVLVLTKLPEPDAKDEAPLLVAHVELQQGTHVQFFVAFTHVDLRQGERWLFPAAPARPAFAGATPSGLQLFRKKELAQLRGTQQQASQTRTGADRVYDYATYNDLGNPAKEATTRPVLGGGQGEYPAYPRRLRTGRPLVPGTPYESTPSGSVPWLPQDDDFDPVKLQAFNGDTENGLGMAVRSAVTNLILFPLIGRLVPVINDMFDKAAPANFASLGVVDTLFHGLAPGDSQEKRQLQGLLPVRRLEDFEILLALQKRQPRWWLPLAIGVAFVGSLGGRLLRALRPGPAVAAPVAPVPTTPTAEEQGGDSLLDLQSLQAIARSLLDKWPAPGVREGRSLQWRTDEEFGRGALAGQNPLSIRTVTAADLQAFTVRDADVSGLLGGRTLSQAVADERLWVLDFVPGIEAFLDKVKTEAATTGSKRVLHAGRCVLFTRDDQETVPVSIELRTADTPFRVFTPKDHQEVWSLAKTIISSLDSGVHQLISHWLTTHACVEPYMIATRRELSILNPVYKLLQPHFRYTMRINANARSSLVNAGGIVESTFTPGGQSMQLSAAVYQDWRFDEQALPANLLKRGVAERRADGSLRVKVPGYRYAEDGLLLWAAMEHFVTDYLSLYYNDSKPGERVTDDAEVLAWWEAVQKQGHPDVAQGWPAVTDIASLAGVLASVMWTTSCHHAAVNFGQYDNSAYFPNKPSMIIGTIPAAGSDEEQALLNCYDENMLQTITPPIQALTVMLTLRILSVHAPDEEYLDAEDHRYIKEGKAVAVHDAFVAALRAAEAEMEKRNAARPASARPYSLLMPSRPPAGGDNAQPPPRGVPYSISI